MKSKIIKVWAAVISSLVVTTVLIPAADASTTLETPAPIVLNDPVSTYSLISTVVRGKGTTGYHLQKYNLTTNVWSTTKSCASICKIKTPTTGASYRLIAYGSSGATSAPSNSFVLFSNTAASGTKQTMGSMLQLYVNRYNIYALAKASLSYDKSLAGRCIIATVVTKGLQTAESQSLAAAKASGFQDPTSDVLAAATQLEKMIRTQFGTSCDAIKQYTKLLAEAAAAALLSNTTTWIHILSIYSSGIPSSCHTYMNDSAGDPQAVNNMVAWSRTKCLAFSNRLWVAS